MFPKRLRQEPRILGLTLVITFISGANFFSILMFWPTQAFNVYGHDPIGVGIRGIPVGFSILAGACIVLWLLSMLRGHNKELLIASSILMTAGCGSLAIARMDNLYQLWGLLVLAGLGIGGKLPTASWIEFRKILGTDVFEQASWFRLRSSVGIPLRNSIIRSTDHHRSNDHLP
jgi:hypothetical protein